MLVFDVVKWHSSGAVGPLCSVTVAFPGDLFRLKKKTIDPDQMFGYGVQILLLIWHLCKYQ